MQSPLPPQEPFEINWWYVALGFYIMGTAFFTLRFIADFLKLYRIFSAKTAIKDGNFKLVDSAGITSPFSFFNYIIYNSALLQPEELEGILVHEKVHSRQKHSADMIISQLFCTLFWFNPLVWLYKKAVAQNLEFIADAETTKVLADTTAYQKTLLKITLQPQHIAITNHFYQSLIKKRIIMLNKSQSKTYNYWRYMPIVPVLAAFIFLFQTEVIAQEKESKIQPSETKRIVVDIDKFSTDKELETVKELFKQEFDADLTFENLRRNPDGQITAMKTVIKDKDHQKAYFVREVTGSTPIESFTIDIESEAGSGINEVNFGKPKTALKKVAYTDTSADTLHVKKTETKTSKKDNGFVTDEPKTIDEHWTINNVKIDDKDLLIIINGVKQNLGDYIKIPLGEELDKMNKLKPKEAKKKYGRAGKNGAIEVTTKKAPTYSASAANSFTNFKKAEMAVNRTTLFQNSQNFDTNASITQRTNSVQGSPYYVVTSARYNTDTNPDTKAVVNQKQLEIQGIDYKKAYISINYKQASAQEFEGLTQDEIYSSYSSFNEDGDIIKYGPKAANGAIVIVTKNFKELEDRYPDSKVTYYIKETSLLAITKDTSKEELVALQRKLKNMGIDSDFSGIKYNKDGKLTAITVNLTDTKNTKNTKSTWKNDKGISTMYVGRKDGGLYLSNKQ
jgi:hypothetical protein